MISTAYAQGLTGTIQDPRWGVRFTVPDGWVGQHSSQGYIFGSSTEAGFVLVLPHEYGRLTALRTEVRKGLDDGFGTRLSIVEATLQSFGERGIAAVLEGTMGGQPAQAYLVSLLAPTGGGITVMSAVSPAAYTDAVARRTEQIAQSVQFAAPSPSPADSDWAAQLKGSRLTYLYSYYSGGASGDYGGVSEKTVIDLCSAGHFVYSGSHSLAVDGGTGSGSNASGYGGGSNQGHGRWTVVQQGGQPTLQLTFPSGSVSTYTISYPDEELHLNGERFFWTTHSSPADYRPQCP